MNTKKNTVLSGTLMTPLLEGTCAFIFSQGQVLRTSRVVAVHSRDADSVRFETMNTNYTLLLNPTPQAAVVPWMTRMAA